MNKEWRSPYNAFNSMKVLVWYDHLKHCVEGNYLPPVTVDTDPTNVCNYNCIWCNSQSYRKRSPETLSTNQLKRLAKFYHEWGVKSTCVAGGGEPLLAKGILIFLEELHKYGIEAGVITNGFFLGGDVARVMAETCRWVGISIDAGRPETYAKIKGIKEARAFYTVLDNVEYLCECAKGTKCDVAYKYLVHPINCAEVYDAVSMAKEIGCKDFHSRPVGWDNIDATKGKDKLSYTEEMLHKFEDDMDMAMELETNDFRVFGIRHKFNPDMSRKVPFEKCRALPILPTFGADGNVHLCFDRRGDKDLILCSHDPEPSEILKHWGTDRHKAMLDSIDPHDCPRCTFSAYNEFVEKGVMADGMCLNFP